MSLATFRAPWWQPGGHVQTIWSALYAHQHPAGAAQGPGQPCWRRERWECADGDFVDVDFSTHPTQAGAPMLVLFHGLEGSSASHYVQATARVCAQRGWQLAVPHFRGCSGEPNRLPRAYHSGDAQEIDWLLRRLKSQRAGPLLALGVSLGGNALALWAGLGQQAPAQVIDAAAAVCAPLDLMAGGTHLGRGLNRWLYTPMFMRTLKAKALAKCQHNPGLLDPARLQRARTLRDFDDIYTAPVHGFVDAQDYWRKASAKPWLHQVVVPLLLLNPRNDPFVPASSLPKASEVSESVTLWQPAHGGHVGFSSGAWPAHLQAMPQAVTDWLAQQLCRQCNGSEESKNG